MSRRLQPLARRRARAATCSATWASLPRKLRTFGSAPTLSNALADEYIGLGEVDDGLWNIVYYRTLLGRIDERTGRSTGVDV